MKIFRILVAIVLVVSGMVSTVGSGGGGISSGKLDIPTGCCGAGLLGPPLPGLPEDWRVHGPRTRQPLRDQGLDSGRL